MNPNLGFKNYLNISSNSSARTYTFQIQPISACCLTRLATRLRESRVKFLRAGVFVRTRCYNLTAKEVAALQIPCGGGCIIWCCHLPPPIVWYGPKVCTTLFKALGSTIFCVVLKDAHRIFQVASYQTLLKYAFKA